MTLLKNMRTNVMTSRKRDCLSVKLGDYTDDVTAEILEKIGAYYDSDE